MVDAKYSALGIAATSRSKLDPQITVLEALDFLSPSTLYRELAKKEFDLVIFSWRFLALDFLSLKFLKNRLGALFQKSSVAIIIPDHMGEIGSLQAKEDILINHVDFFLVTSEKLFDHYSRRFPEKCKGILHDIPDIENIQQVLNEPYLKKSELIWVGNSQWGSRSGFTDHKGFKKIISPLLSRFPEMRIVDSAVRRISNYEVLREIRSSEVLLQSSISEGTGLPILEAAALGVVPITTRVGIAEEFLQGRISNLLVDANVDSYCEAIDWAKKNSDWLPDELKSTFKQYFAGCKTESVYHFGKSLNHFVDGGSDFEIYVRWIIRHIKFRYIKWRNFI